MLDSLQIGRAVAAMLVTLFHMAGIFALEKYFGATGFDHVFSWGDAGVDFFFVLSGFIITTAHARDIGRPEAVGAYARRRLLRIFPTYWLIYVGASGLMFAFPSLREALPPDFTSWLLGALLIPQDPAIVGATGAPVLFVGWSLQYELLFYALFGLAIWRPWVAMLAVFGLVAVQAGCLAGAVCGRFPASFFAADSVPLFVLGVVAAWWARRGPALATPASWLVLGIAGFVGLGMLELAVGRDWRWIDRRLAYGLASALVIVAAVRAERAGELPVASRDGGRPMARLAGWLVRVGDASYALYLLHVPVIVLLCKLFTAGPVRGLVPAPLAFALVFAACVVSALAFARWIERPMLRWLGRRRSRAPSGAGVVA